MNKSESIKNLSKALLLFSQEVGTVAKSAKNPFFKSSYAPLPEILKAIQEPLQKSGLVVTQHPNGENELCTMVIHAETGEYLESNYKVNPSKADPQALGSAITYARRYAIGAILNLNIDEDDDGNKASDRGEKKKDGGNWLNPGTYEWDQAVKYMSDGGSLETIKKKYKLSKDNEEKIKIETLELQ